MGQAASRQAVKQAQKAATTAAPPRPPPLGRPVADAPEVTEDATQALRDRQQRENQELRTLQPPSSSPAAGGPPTTSSVSRTAQAPPRRPPVADQNTGFYRGQIFDPRDAAQEQFWIHQSGGNKELQEMAPDLLKFLQDAGPLQKKVNKQFTSKRIVKEMEEQGEEDGEKSEKMHRFEAAQRSRNDMRLVENIEGFSTPRTTNFFTSPATNKDEELKDFGLSDIDIYALLRRASAEAPKGSGGGKDADVDPDSVCNEFYNVQVAGRVEAAGWTKEEQLWQKKLLKDTVHFLELPVVVKDDDASYLGLEQKELNKEFAHQRIDIVDESRVKLVVADLHDLQRKEIKRIR